MLKKVARFILSIAGGFLGYGAGVLVFSLGRLFEVIPEEILGSGLYYGATSITAIITAILFYFMSPRLIIGIMSIAKAIEMELEKIPASKVMVGSIGLIIGLMIAYLITPIMKIIPIPAISFGLTVVVYVLLGYVGISFSTRKIGEMSRLPELLKRPAGKGSTKQSSGAKPKILDTSVIIDGRIADILKTGFIEGAVVIPEFVLEELRHIADSSDSLKRVRGRRGLDILKMIQEETKIEVRISDVNFDDTEEVDIKLLKLAKKIDGVVVTNDFNLNKVAAVQSVPVLNINELANAVKPVVLPGEEMFVLIVKEGKEANQGVAYLDDGTMIVIEGGRKRINESLDVTVTSVLQTSAGRMIFAKPSVS